MSQNDTQAVYSFETLRVKAAWTIAFPFPAVLYAVQFFARQEQPAGDAICVNFFISLDYFQEAPFFRIKLPGRTVSKDPRISASFAPVSLFLSCRFLARSFSTAGIE
jgi:hypothetical protein